MIARSTLTATLALVAHGLFAQQVIGAAGSQLDGAAISIAYSIGEPVTTTASAGSAILTQGFEQPWADVSTVIAPTGEDNSAITIYPNPVREELNIALGRIAKSERFDLYDAEGKLVRTGTIISDRSIIDMNDVASGSYALRIVHVDATVLGTYKIIVNH